MAARRIKAIDVVVTTLDRQIRRFDLREAKAVYRTSIGSRGWGSFRSAMHDELVLAGVVVNTATDRHNINNDKFDAWYAREMLIASEPV